MRIYLDDIRNPTTDGWVVVRNATECMQIINKNIIDEISFDHDLSDTSTSELTGYTVAVFIERMCYYKKMKCPKWNVHSANPVGRKNIEDAMKNAERYSKG